MGQQFRMYLTLPILLFAQMAFTHGEDKPGPHGGFIRMPGAFHTEIVPSGAQKFKVYLLDIEWKNPSLKDSSLEIILKNKAESSAVKCEAQTDFYSCTLPKGSNLKKGSLEVTSRRENQTGNKVTYDLPLKLQKIDDGHGAHH